MIEILNIKPKSGYDGYELLYGYYDVLAKLPENATNGDVVKALWNVETWMYDDDTICVEYEGILGIKLYPLSWWNAPYKIRR